MTFRGLLKNAVFRQRFGRFPAALLLAAALLPQAAAAVSREDIFILHPDGQGYTVAKTLRSDLPKRQLYLPPGASPEDYVYIHPTGYEVADSPAGTRLTFDAGSYALMGTGRFEDWQLTKNTDGSVTFHSWDGRELDNGHYGKWNTPEPFANFAYVWVVPANIEILSYTCNRQGEGQWTKQGNTLSWTGHDVNDLTFRITFKRQAAAPNTVAFAPAPPATALATAERVTLDAAVLFASGSSDITPAGRELLTALAQRLTAADPARVVAEGHSDDQPLKPYLRERYPSNWALSAARATGVVRWLAEHGVDPAILEAHALGAQRPVASNDTPEGRARNRRIEIIIVGADTPKAVEPGTSQDPPQ